MFRPKTSSARKSMYHVGALLALTLLEGCAKKLPPQTLPQHFEGTMAIDAYNIENFAIDWKQQEAKMTGTYSAGQVKGEVTATTAGNVVDATFHVSPEDQKKAGYPAELKCTLTIGNVSAVEVSRRYGLNDARSNLKAPDYLKPGSPDLMQLGGFLDFKSGDHKFHRILTLTNSTIFSKM